VDEQRQLRAKKEQTYNTVEQAVLAYRVKNKKVKSICRVDKEQWVDAKFKEAEEAAARGDSKTYTS